MGDNITAHMRVTWQGTARLPYSQGLVRLTVSQETPALDPHDLSVGESGHWGGHSVDGRVVARPTLWAPGPRHTPHSHEHTWQQITP